LLIFVCWHKDLLLTF